MDHDLCIGISTMGDARNYLTGVIFEYFGASFILRIHYYIIYILNKGFNPHGGDSLFHFGPCKLAGQVPFYIWGNVSVVDYIVGVPLRPW